MTNKLVAYFSATATTEKAAKNLAAAIDADLFEIEPAQRYSDANLNWNDKRSRSSVEMGDEACRPALAAIVDNIGSYDTVFVGFPVWWYVEPRIIDTFLEAHDFTGKAIVPFATSGGSGLGKAPERMQQLVPGANVLAGKMLNGRLNMAELKTWAENL